MALRYTITARSRATRARRGIVSTTHGDFDTPAFMPVGTRGTVKGVLPHLLAGTGAQICLGNTYHLLLRPGPERVAALGGLHKMMNWPRPILTDSGGYQAFSMADINTVNDDGVTFKSIIDGASIHLSPERATQVQNQLGADIIMAFDDCPPAQVAAPTSDPNSADAPAGDEPRATDPRAQKAITRDTRKKKYDHPARLKTANERTLAWLQRCKDAHQRPHDQSLFGIIQGGADLDQRSWSAERITNIELPGYAIGGVAVGEGFQDIVRVVKHTAPLMPDNKPRYLMGVGYERDLLAAVLSGVDMFDCVLPTRNARNASVFTPTGHMRLRNAQYADDQRPLVDGCDCVACAGWESPSATAPGFETETGYFSRAYLRHLFLAEEMLGPILVTLHNLRHFQRFMADVRATIATDDWPGLVARYPVAAEGLAAFG
ncbi:MAG: tRNA guanosine(34) transglycosylase Tgt [Phycisphaerales bacterium]